MSPVELITKDGTLVAPESTYKSNTLSDDSPLVLKGLTVSYYDKPAIFSIDFIAPLGKMIAIVGPNGAGKSTLLQATLDIVPKVSGSVHVFGKSLQTQLHRIAYVPQRSSVDWDFPARVIDVVLMGLYRDIGLFQFSGKKQKKKAMECLERVAMVDFADRQIGQLSGGQQQRVFLARALAQNADLYMLDEPFAGVDATTERAIVSVLEDLKSEKRTVICVHHDLATVRQYFDHVLFINVRKIAEGPVEMAFTAENLQTTYGGRLAATHIEDLSLHAGSY